MKLEKISLKNYPSLREKENPIFKIWKDDRNVHTNRPKAC
jgi:hypothetical protein